MTRRPLHLVLATLLGFAFPASAQHGAEQEPPPYAPTVASASTEGSDAVSGFVLPEGFAAALFAAEPHLANPVCFAIDASLGFYVAETFRLHAGVTDMRSHMDWLDDELACETVEDRVEMMRRHEGDAFEEKYAQEHERVRLIRDTDGDGVADASTVFADGFSHPAMGIAAGLLPVGGDVYYACIPDLWVLTDADGDGVAERRVSQHTGWGVHIALLGHDMHGLQRGPDGRLYWSIGDRGFHVEHEGRVHAHPHAGAVLRSELDGSNLEVFATGLRNPQELAFDDRGNLFTGDNNSDGGDRARWVYLVEGGEIGWRHAYQYVTWPNRRGPWNAEKQWHPPHAGQPAFLLPPVANFADGPSGLTYYPGTGWGPDWRGTFFLCDFRGQASVSGVHAFENAPRGAGFELVEARKFLWNALPTDVDFGPDGQLYVSDWVSGWGMTGKGRIYRVGPTADEFAGERAELAALLGEGMQARGAEELVGLLDHGHRQVRLEAQWELAERAVAAPGDGWRSLTDPLIARLADESVATTPRLHALWGLAHAMRLRPGLADALVPALLARHRDADAEIRAQAMRWLGDLRWAAAAPVALRGLEDESARVRGFAAEALGKFGTPDAFDPLLDLLEETGASDPWLRHQVVWALVGLSRGGLGDREALAALATDPRPAVRLGATVALRRLAHPGVARFLADDDPAVVAEAARAIYDVPIVEAMGDLAALLDRLPAGSDPYLVRRALNACRHVGRERDAQRVVGRMGLGEAFAIEALRVLAEWDRPSPRDPIGGSWRPLPAREVRPLERHAGALAAAAAGSSDAAAREYVRAIAGRPSFGPTGPVAGSLDRIFRDEGRDAGLRAEALRALVAQGAELGATALEDGALDGEARVRAAAFELLGRREPLRALALLDEIVGGPRTEVRARQEALRALAGLDHPAVAGSLARHLERAAVEDPSGPLVLELQDVAAGRDEPAVRAALERLRAAQDERDATLGEWLYALQGGDPDAGRRVFLEKAETGCLRCHAYGAEGGSEVGPDLSGVGARLAPREILHSIVDPNASVAPEYENWLFGLGDGEVVVGRILAEDGSVVRVETPQKETVELLQEEVEARRKDLSSMPQDVSTHLSRTELRDLIAFLAAQKE